MSRRDKKKMGNPNPPRSSSWLESRVRNITPARVLSKVQIGGKDCIVYPVGNAKKMYSRRG